MKSRFPLGFIDVLCNWYGKLSGAERWHGMLSTVFSIGSGVIQGGTLSPALFNLFINVIIINLQNSGFGCRVRQIYTVSHKNWTVSHLSKTLTNTA